VVLVADDDIELRDAMSSILGAHGLTVLAASDGVEALEKALTCSVDIVLLDQHMPRMTGVEVQQALHEAGFTRPIIIISGVASREPASREPASREPASREPASREPASREPASREPASREPASREPDRPDKPVGLYLRKPFDTEDLLRAVGEALAGSGSEPANLVQPKGSSESGSQLSRGTWSASVWRKRLAGEVLRRRHRDEVTLKQDPASPAVDEREEWVMSEFLRMMAHELKTPITAMHLQMRLLEREAEVARSPGLREGLDRIGRSCNRLLQLIDTCVEWARVVRSARLRLETETFALVPLVAKVIAEFGSHAQTKGIKIELIAPDGLPALSSDRRLVRLVLLNLVSQAVQSTEEGSITVSVDEAEGCHKVQVTDGGLPIDEAWRDEIISTFQSRVDPRWQAGSGSGLALYVVRDIVRAIHGDVVLHSTSRSGNTFVVTFPTLTPGGEPRA
jgi:signal transduction histidine kinase